MQLRGYHNIKLLRSIQTLAWLSIPAVLIFPALFNFTAFITGIVFITAIGSSAGLHRYFGHRSFKTGKLRHWFLAFVTTLATQGSIAIWAVYHRAHHVYSDTEDDPISPSVIGMWRAFFALQDIDGYKDIRPRHIVTELKDPAVKFFHDWYWVTIGLYVLVLGLINPILIVNMYLLPVGVIRFVYGLQNTFGHGMPAFCGYRRYDTKDNSRNNPLTNILTFCMGETLHNTHHAHPGRYMYSDRWYELDLTGLVIKMVFAK